MELVHKKERDIDFFNVCESIRKHYGKQYVSVTDIAHRAIGMPAQSFYMAPKEYCRIIRKMQSGKVPDGLSPAKKSLYHDIYRIYLHESAACSHENKMSIARKIAEMNAPRFYLSPKRAAKLYYELLKTKNV